MEISQNCSKLLSLIASRLNFLVEGIQFEMERFVLLNFLGSYLDLKASWAMTTWLMFMHQAIRGVVTVNGIPVNTAGVIMRDMVVNLLGNVIHALEKVFIHSYHRAKMRSQSDRLWPHGMACSNSEKLDLLG